MSLEALNSRISYVAQDQYLFNTSLLENIRLGRLDATDEEVMEAAKKAQCMEFLEKLPQGIHSWQAMRENAFRGSASEFPGASNIEGCPAGLTRPRPMLIQKMRKKMEAAIAELVKGKTFGSYRSQTSRYNERRSNMRYGSRGKMVATGKHQELIQACPEYQKLWKAAPGQRRVGYCKAREDKCLH